MWRFKTFCGVKVTEKVPYIIPIIQWVICVKKSRSTKSIIKKNIYKHYEVITLFKTPKY